MSVVYLATIIFLGLHGNVILWRFLAYRTEYNNSDMIEIAFCVLLYLVLFAQSLDSGVVSYS